MRARRRHAAWLGAAWVPMVLMLMSLMPVAPCAGAREFRSLNPIATPGARPDGAEVVAQFVPVERRLVERAVYALAAAWNGEGLDPLLAEDYVDGSRLRDVIAELVPRDATLRVRAIEAPSTLEQYRVRDDAGAWQRVSTVSVIVLTQVEFVDPRTGFQRLEGRNELFFRVEQAEEDAGATGTR